MKNLFKFLFVLAILSGSATFSQVGIGTTTPAASAMFDVTSTTKGFLPPRMTSTQMNAIAAPAAGLMVYCSNCTPAGLYTSDGSAWTAVGDTSGGSNNSGGVSVTMAFTTGTWIWGGSSVTRNIVISITNNSFGPVSWVNATGDLVLSGGNTGLTVGAPTAAGGTSSGTTTTIASGVTGTVTFPVTGVIGNLNEITATWTKLALTVAGTKVVTAGNATFTNTTNTVFVFSANASGINTLGTLAIGTTVTLPYTAGAGSYTAYTSPDVAIPSQFCNDGASDWTFAYSYLAGTFASSGSITATLITKKGGTATAWPAFQVTNIATINVNCVSAPIVINGVALSNSVGITEGGDAIRGQLTTNAAAYDAAAVDTWVAITNAEYTLLQNSANVNGAGTYLTANSIMNSNTNEGYNNVTLGSYAGTPATNFVAVPNNNYIYAFRLRTQPGWTNTANGIVRFNGTSTAVSNFTPLGTSGGVAGRLPNPYGTFTTNTLYSFVLKRPTAKTTLAAGLVTVFCPADGYIGGVNSGVGSYNYNAGNVANMATAIYTNVATSLPCYQVLATPTKSW
jgi:hypothetical protein